MAISPYRQTDPFDRLWDSLLGSGGGITRGGSLIRSPATDVLENESEIRVVAELPGLSPDNVEIDLENNVLTISGEKSEERTEGSEEGTYHLAERRYGRFSRSFILPRDVDSENIAASFENGVLTVRVPKSERARRRRIEIGSGGQQGQQVPVQGGSKPGGNREQRGNGEQKGSR